MIGIPQFSPTPQGAVRVELPGFEQTVSTPPVVVLQPGRAVSHRLLVIPMLGLLPAPTHTSQPSSLNWKELPVLPQSALNGEGSSPQLVRNLRP